MERVLVSDILCPRGHRALDYSIIKILSKLTNVVLVHDGKYFNGLECDDQLIKRRAFILHPQRIEIVKQFFYIISFLQIAFYANHEGCNKILLLSYNVKAFAFTRWAFIGKKVIVLHHNDIDRMQNSKSELRKFNKFKNEVSHVLLNNFIQNGLKDAFKVKESQLYVANTLIEISHNLYNIDCTYRQLIGIGQSNDEKMIADFINLDKAELIDSSKCRILLRSNEVEYKGNAVNVIRGYIKQDEYNRLYKSAYASLICYPKTFCYRSSGSVEDSLSNKKIVLLTDFPAAHAYLTEYPRNCILCGSAKDVLDKLLSNDFQFDVEEFIKFVEIHSLANVESQWNQIIKNI